MISFFPVRDIPLRFISLHLSFLVPTSQIDSIFVYTLRRVHDLSCSIFLVSYRDKNVNFRIFGGRGLYFQSCLNKKLGSSNLFKTNRWNTIQSSGVLWYFPPNFFVKFLSKKPKFLNFFETDLTFPIANCVSQLWRSLSTNSFVGCVCVLLSCFPRS